jgi:hypothetical protein
MFETFLQTQPIHQKCINNAASFDAHLHCWSPLHSTTHGNNPKITDPKPCKKSAATVVGVSMFTCLFSVAPIGWFMYYYYVTHRMHFKETFVIHVFITNFIKIRCIIRIWLWRLADVRLFVPWLVSNEFHTLCVISQKKPRQKLERRSYATLRNKERDTNLMTFSLQA